MHVGSKYAVCSDHPTIDEIDEDDKSYTAEWRVSPNQRKLNEAWHYCRDKVSQRATALIVNGEPIDGANPKSLGDSVWSTEINDQLSDSQKLLSELPYDKLYFVRGSGYHTQMQATNYEKTLAKLMQSESYKSIMGNKTKADYEANFEVFGKHFNFTHHIGYSGWMQYRPTPMARELVKMHFAHNTNGFHTDVAIRSHVHYYCRVEFPHTQGFTTPAWKFPDGFMYRRGEPELPNLGMVEIIVESNGKIDINPIICEIEFKKNVIHL